MKYFSLTKQSSHAKLSLNLTSKEIKTMSTATVSKSCATCAYWNSADAAAGQCRRHAPTTVAFKVDDATKFESHFPETKAADWCGDYASAD